MEYTLQRTQVRQKLQYYSDQILEKKYNAKLGAKKYKFISKKIELQYVFRFQSSRSQFISYNLIFEIETQTYEM
ncbi:hypothetical protein pb186bvf_020618 [Paramecium bursaria]